VENIKNKVPAEVLLWHPQQRRLHVITLFLTFLQSHKYYYVLTMTTLCTKICWYWTRTVNQKSENPVLWPCSLTLTFSGFRAVVKEHVHDICNGIWHANARSVRKQNLRMLLAFAAAFDYDL